jgi:hypothetical protein
VSACLPASQPVLSAAVLYLLCYRHCSVRQLTHPAESTSNLVEFQTRATGRLPRCCLGRWPLECARTFVALQYSISRTLTNLHCRPGGGPLWFCLPPLSICWLLLICGCMAPIARKCGCGFRHDCRSELQLALICQHYQRQPALWISLRGNVSAACHFCRWPRE